MGKDKRKTAGVSRQKSQSCGKGPGRPRGDMTPNTLLAERLQQIWRAGNWPAISARIGVSSDTVGRYLRGDTSPTEGFPGVGGFDANEGEKGLKTPWCVHNVFPHT